MNNTIKLAVASALLAAASSANAGIMIPAGDWTLDIGGVVNAYYTSTRVSGNAVNDTGTKTASNITTGLLPNYLSVSGKTRASTQVLQQHILVFKQLNKKTVKHS
jgi:hypothetical protein